jgi:hypothetical protein
MGFVPTAITTPNAATIGCKRGTAVRDDNGWNDLSTFVASERQQIEHPSHYWKRAVRLFAIETWFSVGAFQLDSFRLGTVKGYFKFVGFTNRTRNTKCRVVLPHLFECVVTD